MTKKFFGIYLFLLITGSIYATPRYGCYFTKGAFTEITTFDGNYYPTVQTYSVLQVDTLAGSLTSTIRLATTKGNDEMIDTIRFVCDTDGTFISPDINFTGQGIYVEYPAILHPGRILEARVNPEKEGKTSKSGIKIGKRKVLAIDDNVSTPAGSWKCVKISYSLNIKEKGGGLPKRLTVIEWFVPDFGIVKTEIYRGDSLESRSLLTVIADGEKKRFDVI
ncbi:MAG: hypothetical protein LBQ60_11155 [Bacteroidales bacterium]|jgi:hypothetical protein|nr:hypothetical protein [Bacteroidales bacterium]